MFERDILAANVVDGQFTAMVKCLESFRLMDTGPAVGGTS